MSMPQPNRLPAMEAGQDPTQPLIQPNGRQRRNPFYCADLCFSWWEYSSSFLPNRPQVTGYLSGFLFALGWWFFIDGLAYTSSHFTDKMNPIAFEDWVPGIVSTLALVVVNIIDRERFLKLY